MSPQEVIRTELPKVEVMQLATSINDQPWICNLHFCSDDKLNIYWLSQPKRRHSKESQLNPKVSAAFLVHVNNKLENYVSGISVEGICEQLDRKEYPAVIKLYSQKFDSDKDFLEEVKNGTNPHVFYKLTPKNFVLFDTKNFKENPRQEWRI